MENNIAIMLLRRPRSSNMYLNEDMRDMPVKKNCVFVGGPTNHMGKLQFMLFVMPSLEKCPNVALFTLVHNHSIIFCVHFIFEPLVLLLKCTFRSVNIYISN